MTRQILKENIEFFTKEFYKGNYTLNELRHRLIQFRDANLYGTKYMKDYGRVRAENIAFFYDDFVNKTIEKILLNTSYNER
tara:strand:- start:233 stop:475 length:243 start_codon:yes stop_codon:yes gene_type:complete